MVRAVFHKSQPCGSQSYPQSTIVIDNTLADEILRALHDEREALSPKRITRLVDASYDTVRSTLITMRDRGQLVQPKRGLYEVPAVPEPQQAAVGHAQALRHEAGAIVLLL